MYVRARQATALQPRGGDQPNPILHEGVVARLLESGSDHLHHAIFAAL